MWCKCTSGSLFASASVCSHLQHFSMWHGWKRGVEARLQEEKDMEKMNRNLGSLHAKDKRHQERIDREVLKRIRQQQNATAVASGERSAYTPSLIYGKDSHKMPQPQEVADAVSLTETEKDNIMNIMETRYKNKMYADSGQKNTGDKSPWNRIANPPIYDPPPCVSRAASSIYEPPPCVRDPPVLVYHHHARARR